MECKRDNTLKDNLINAQGQPLAEEKKYQIHVHKPRRANAICFRSSIILL